MVGKGRGTHGSVSSCFFSHLPYRTRGDAPRVCDRVSSLRTVTRRRITADLRYRRYMRLFENVSDDDAALDPSRTRRSRDLLLEITNAIEI